LHLNPHIAVNADDEKSCYAVLLLHTPWPQGDEDAILGPSPTTAVERLAYLRRCKKLPAYVESFLDKVEYSETIMQAQGIPQPGFENDEEVVEDDIINDARPELRLEDNDDDDDNDSSHDGDESMETVISTDIDPATGTSIYENVSKQKMTSLKCYISVQQRKFMDNYLLENQLSATEMQRTPDIHFKI
jgi:hypothetical protein